MSTACSALISLLLSLAPDSRLRPMVFWLIGDVSASRWQPTLSVLLLAALALCLRQARAINVLVFMATTPTPWRAAARLRRVLFLTAVALTAGGGGQCREHWFYWSDDSHACRFVSWQRPPRVALPAATLAGGLLLLLADVAARTVAAPMQLPVGVITALIGVPAFCGNCARCAREAGHERLAGQPGADVEAPTAAPLLNALDWRLEAGQCWR